MVRWRMPTIFHLQLFYGNVNCMEDQHWYSDCRLQTAQHVYLKQYSSLREMVLFMPPVHTGQTRCDVLNDKEVSNAVPAKPSNSTCHFSMNTQLFSSLKKATKCHNATWMGQTAVLLHSFSKLSPDNLLKSDHRTLNYIVMYERSAAKSKLLN
jgi:hypothetical protein